MAAAFDRSAAMLLLLPVTHESGLVATALGKVFW
jgi:hypothetical protein